MPRNPNQTPRRQHERELLAAHRKQPILVGESDYPFAAAARLRLLRPHDEVDAVCLAFAAAIDEVLRARQARLMREQPSARQASRTVAGFLAKQLKMSPQTLRETRSGDRWVTLADVITGLNRTDNFAPVLKRHLGWALRDSPNLLRRDASEHPTPTPSRGEAVSARDGDSVEDTGTRRLKEADVLELEDVARDAITRLADAQERVASAGKALPATVDWMAVRRALDPLAYDTIPANDEASTADTDTVLPGRRAPETKELSGYGIDNLNEDVRAVFRDGQAHAPAEVITRVSAMVRQRQIERGLPVEEVPSDPIRNALWRLHSRPKDESRRWLIHSGNTYQPGPRMLRELNEKGTTSTP